MALSRAMWGVVPIDSGSEVEHSLGALRLRLRRRADELWIHAAHDDEVEPSASSSARVAQEEEVEPGSADAESWIRWALPAGREVELRASLPDRPVVVSPEQPFFLPPAGRARVFVRIPLFVRVQLPRGDGGGETLEKFPTVVLSDTWWGTFTEGEVAYWLGTHARREMGPSLHEPHLAICPFVLINDSEQALPVERFAVRVAYLTLFGHGPAVWTDEVQVRYRGADEGSEIRYTGRIPADAGDVERMAASRESAPRGLHARTFGRLRARVGAL